MSRRRSRSGWWPYWRSSSGWWPAALVRGKRQGSVQPSCHHHYILPFTSNACELHVTGDETAAQQQWQVAAARGGRQRQRAP